MATNEGHIHWGGVSGETVTYLGQSLQFAIDASASMPIGNAAIRAEGFAGTGLSLPNSTNSQPKWDAVPGTSPVLEVRQDGHYPTDYIRIRQA